MITRDEMIKKYWNYYLILEKRVLATTDYVAIDNDNMGVFSNEFALLLQAIGGELDSFFKEYCGFRSNDESKNIGDYSSYVLNDFPTIIDQEIDIMEADITLKPFEKWNKAKAKQSLSWWEAYDNIKHSRYYNRKNANLRNVLNGLAGLYLLEMYYIKKIVETSGLQQPDRPNRESQIFTLKNWNYHYIPLNGALAIVDGQISMEYEEK